MGMTGAAWRTSTYSGSNGGECVEVAARGGHVLIRDSKNRQGPVLRVSRPRGASSPARSRTDARDRLKPEAWTWSK